MFDFLPCEVENLIWRTYFKDTVLKQCLHSSIDVFVNSKGVPTRVNVVCIRNRIHYANTDSLHKYFHIVHSKPHQEFSMSNTANQ